MNTQRSEVVIELALAGNNASALCFGGGARPLT
jgi:hypothetical protein